MGAVKEGDVDCLFILFFFVAKKKKNDKKHFKKKAKGIFLKEMGGCVSKEGQRSPVTCVCTPRYI
jgi:hypothetical protein